MGYTHYWGHKRRFTFDQWDTITQDITAILTQAVAEGLQLGDAMGTTPTTPATVFGTDDDPRVGPFLRFNGLGDEALETFEIHKLRTPSYDWQQDAYIIPRDKAAGGGFCKTARKSYDVAVSAILCYLESTTEGNFIASSDGDSRDLEWQDGLALAKRALPRLDNVLVLPFAVRWEGTFDRHKGTYTDNYSIRQRIDGVWVIISKRTPYQPLAYITPERADAFLAALTKRFKSVPTSCFGGEDYKRMTRKQDAAVRDMLTYPELTQGAPESLVK